MHTNVSFSEFFLVFFFAEKYWKALTQKGALLEKGDFQVEFAYHMLKGTSKAH